MEIAIQEELQGSSSLLGYRSLWRRLKFHHNILVPRFVSHIMLLAIVYQERFNGCRYVVMRILSFVSPIESQQRKTGRLHRRVYDCKVCIIEAMCTTSYIDLNEGPNFVWHVDGMDKLKPYGFSIHGCIDG